MRSLLNSGYHDMELRRILNTHLKLLTGKCNEDFFQDNSSDITKVSSHCYAHILPLAIVAITEQLVVYIPGEIVVVR